MSPALDMKRVWPTLLSPRLAGPWRPGLCLSASLLVAPPTRVLGPPRATSGAKVSPGADAGRGAQSCGQAACTLVAAQGKTWGRRYKTKWFENGLVEVSWVRVGAG